MCPIERSPRKEARPRVASIGIVASAAASLDSRAVCACSRALESAIITPLARVPEETKRDLAPILSRRARVMEVAE